MAAWLSEMRTCFVGHLHGFHGLFSSGILKSKPISNSKEFICHLLYFLNPSFAICMNNYHVFNTC